MNASRKRLLQRAREALAARAARQEQMRARASEQQIIGADRAPDTRDPRAKSTGHGQKTADKWNQ